MEAPPHGKHDASSNTPGKRIVSKLKLQMTTLLVMTFSLLYMAASVITLLENLGDPRGWNIGDACLHTEE